MFTFTKSKALTAALTLAVLTSGIALATPASASGHCMLDNSTNRSLTQPMSALQRARHNAAITNCQAAQKASLHASNNAVASAEGTNDNGTESGPDTAEHGVED